MTILEPFINNTNILEHCARCSAVVSTHKLLVSKLRHIFRHQLTSARRCVCVCDRMVSVDALKSIVTEVKTCVEHNTTVLDTTVRTVSMSISH